MKKITFILLTIAIAFASCDKKDTPEIDKGKLDPNAMILLKPAKGVKLRATVKGLTALEVVQKAVNIKWTSHYFGNKYEEKPVKIARTFMDSQRDLETPALKMLGIDVISMDGDYYRDLTYATDVYITTFGGDSIAYVPDAVIATARTQIETAFENKNYTECYRLFNEAFTFLPFPNE